MEDRSFDDNETWQPDDRHQWRPDDAARSEFSAFLESAFAGAFEDKGSVPTKGPPVKKLRFEYLDTRHGERFQLRIADIDRPGPSDALVDPDEILIAEDSVTLLFDYPLQRPVLMEFDEPGGFTRRRLASLIGRTYREIYALEDAVSGDVGLLPGTLNRAPSDGPYAIWGHVLDDLILECVVRYEDGSWAVWVGS